MKFSLEFERTLPHAIDKVWTALNDREALASWLMDNDFQPVAGRPFRLVCTDGRDHTDNYICKIIESVPPHRLVWSWTLEDHEDQGIMTVEFNLSPTKSGTLLRVRHAGDFDPDIINSFKGGWPGKLIDLGTTLARG